jgi:hypothetical protein
LLIADGDIPTTRLVARELRVVHPEVEVRVPDTLFGADVRRRPVLISRLCHPSMRWLPGYFAEQGSRYAYFLDDNFWELTDESDPYLAEHFRHPAVPATLDAFIRGAWRVVVWSARLAEYVRHRFPGVDVACVAAGFDLSAVAKPLAAAGARRDGDFCVGYPTTRKVALAPLLHEIVERTRAAFGDTVRFEFMGWMPDTLGNSPNATLLPQVDDYAAYLAFMIGRGWDAAIAPLMPGRFESFKTDIKYREYGGCRIPGIYSRVPPYDDSVEDGRTGILVANEAQAWVDAIARLRSDRALGHTIADAAFADIAARRDISITGRRLAEAIAE